MNITKCDCCGKTGQGVYDKMKMPIRITNAFGETVLSFKKIDICEKCMSVISNAYYAEAERNGYSGLRGIETVVGDYEIT